MSTDQQQTNEIIKLDKSKLPQTTSLPMILESYSAINGVIEKMHQNIQVVFKRREAELLANYKKEMIKAQRQLKELSESTSENELRRRMIQKKEELESERQIYIKQSIEFSDRCKDLKQSLQEVISNTKDMENEIRFLDEQLIYAQKHNETLKEELTHLKEDKSNAEYQYRFKGIVQFDDRKQSALVDAKTRCLKAKRQGDQLYLDEVISKNQWRIMRENSAPKSFVKFQKEVPTDQLKLELERQKQINTKLKKLLDGNYFDETPLEKHFINAVQTVIHQKDTQDKKQLELQRRKPKPQILDTRSTNASVSQQQIDFTTLSSDALSDFYKRRIFEEMLEKEEVKKIVHELLFPIT